jgi:hypothetical protein
MGGHDRCDLHRRVCSLNEGYGSGPGFCDEPLVGRGSVGFSILGVVSVNRRPVTTLAILAGLLVVPAFTRPASGASAAPGVPARTTRVSVATGGTQANSYSDSVRFAISGNGRYVAFTSAASNLVPGDTNAAKDVFVRDRVAGTTTRVSVATRGTQAHGDSTSAAISGNGRYVAFTSAASNLVAGDTNGAADVFVRDRVAGTTTRVSVATRGAQANRSSNEPAISGNGRYVTFWSGASNLVARDTNGALDVFVRDRVAGTTTRVSVANGGTQANSDSESPGAISADGRYVTFVSGANNLVAGDTNDTSDAFVRDRVAGTTTRVSVATGGTQADSYSFSSSISGNGRYVAFDSPATNLVAGDTNGPHGSDVFVRDRVAGTTTRVSVATGGTQANNVSDAPAISGDGRYVAFLSMASNLAPGWIDDRLHVFVRDRVAGTTTRATVATDGTQASTLSSNWPAISDTGRYVVFTSWAINLVAGDTNHESDVFVHDRGRVRG